MHKRRPMGCDGQETAGRGATSRIGLKRVGCSSHSYTYDMTRLVTCITSCRGLMEMHMIALGWTRLTSASASHSRLQGCQPLGVSA